MTDTRELKKALRRRVRTLKAEVPPAAMRREAEAVFAAIEALPEFAAAGHILLYYSLPDELPSHFVVERWAAAGKNVYLPRMTGPGHMEAVPSDGTNLSDDNPFHVMEPQGPASNHPIDMVIVPAVALDRRLHRMGRGKGYYDHWLAEHPDALRVGVALDCQLLDTIPTEPHDVALHHVFTASTHLQNT
ncbi:MAG: 5-formyltetrahydrofolate cyclo-ligase [Muribaculaceae bacterium]|nr:5-formyltetrahydrofolate cyclo-ligase [Muribaculaceae bacterium]